MKRQLNETTKRLLSAILKEDSDGDGDDSPKHALAKRVKNEADGAADFHRILSAFQDQLVAHQEKYPQKSGKHETHFARVDRIVNTAKSVMGGVEKKKTAALRGAMAQVLPDHVTNKDGAPAKPAKRANPSGANVTQVGKPGMLKK